MGNETSDSDIDWVNEQLTRHFVGRTLEQLRVGSGIALEFGDSYEISVETLLSVTRSDEDWDGEPLNVDTAGAVTPLLHTDLTSARVNADGGLHLEFGDAVIDVPPHDSYEAWQLRGPGNLLVVCAPSGSVAVFPPAGSG